MKQFAWFDCVRCAAIFLVIYAHGGDFWRSLPQPAEMLLANLSALAWVGVELFFVLSGFLVSGLLFAEHDRTGALDIGRFLTRRAFKIIPPFYFMLLVTIAFCWATHRELKPVHLVHDFLFIQNYRLGTWPHGWTLALEVHFYILLALLLHFLARHSRRGDRWLHSLPWILGGILVLCFVARLVNSLARGAGHHFDVHRELEPSHLHLDVLAAGVLLRYLYNYHFASLALLRRVPLFWAALGLALVLPSAWVWSPHSALATALMPTCNALGFALLLFQVTQLPFPAAGLARGLARPFDYLGKHSYSIYVWHMPVRDWFIAPYFPHDSARYFLVFFPAALLVGAFFSEVLEMPVLRLRDWLFPSQAGARRAA